MHVAVRKYTRKDIMVKYALDRTSFHTRHMLRSLWGRFEPQAFEHSRQTMRKPFVSKIHVYSENVDVSKHVWTWWQQCSPTKLGVDLSRSSAFAFLPLRAICFHITKRVGQTLIHGAQLDPQLPHHPTSVRCAAGPGRLAMEAQQSTSPT